ncbi:MAG: hypothetical protein ACRCYS_16080 [Beijerinckiaceae bacterium]
MEINSYLLRERLPVITLAANGPVGAAATTVDEVSHIGVTASAANLTFTIPNPTDPRSGRDFIITNTGVNAFTVLGMRIDANRFGHFIWDATETLWQSPAVPLASGADFWRSGSLPGLMPDGTADTQDAIFRSGQTAIDTGVNGDSGLTLDDLRSRNSVQLTAGDAGVTDTNMTAIGVDLLGKVRLSNALSYPDLRATNPNPQDFAAGTYYAFKQSATVGLTGANYIGIPTYVGVETTRRYASGTDFSGGPVIQRVFLEDGRSYYRTSVNGTTWGAWNLEGVGRSDLQTRFTSQANTRISVSNEIRWSGFYHIMTTGTNGAEPGGHFRIDMPADGFAVPVAGGGTRAVVPAVANSSIDTGGIPLNAWETLWYRHPYGQNQTFVPGNLLIVPYTANTNTVGPFLNPDEWVKIASRDDAQTWSLGTGDVVGIGSHTGRGGKITADNWTAMKQRVMGDGYFFSPGGNTAVPLAFGFTGTIRWIDGGSTPVVNTAGYRDAGPAQKAAGTVIRGVNGAANRTWRLMTAAEKPEWFGGAQRGVNPILTASTTVVDIIDNETLYFVPTIDAGSGTNGEWVIAGYAGFVSTPVHWLPIASRQVTGAHTTMQVLLGGVQMALKAGDALFTSIGGEHVDNQVNRKITHKGLKYCRWTQNGFFSGAAANGVVGGQTDGLMVSWDNNTMMFGISEGYVSWGNQFSYINMPAAGSAIPVASPNSNVTRVVQNISGRAYVPLSVWEALFFIPPAYTGGYTSVAGDFVIGDYSAGNVAIPRTAIVIAKYEGALTSAAGSTNAKTRVWFADGTYIQPGYTRPTSGAVAVQNDQAQGTGDWRPLVYPGQTGPGMTAAMPATPGVGGAYGAPWTAFYNYRTSNDDPRGFIHLEGLILLNGSVTGTQRIAFLPGVNVRGEPIMTVPIQHTTGTDAKMVNGQIRFQNTTINGSSGVQLMAYDNSFNTAVNPYFTLGVNGGALAQGVPNWVSLSNIILPHA